MPTLKEDKFDSVVGCINPHSSLHHPASEPLQSTRTRRLPLIRDRVAGAADSAETPRRPSPQTPPPAPPGGAQGRWDVPGTPPEEGVQEASGIDARATSTGSSRCGGATTLLRAPPGWPLQSNIFYLMEYREIFLTLLRKYDETKQPQSYLRDLVESTHLFLRMLERFCKGRKNLIVQKKKVRRKKSQGKEKQSAQESSPEVLAETWKIVEEELRATGFQLSASLTESIVPFDAASETPPEEQRTEAMIRVQDALLARLGPEALALLRAAREVWPDGDVFGSSDVEPEEELDLLKQIFHANLPRPSPETVAEDDDDGAELDEEELELVQLSEKEFNFLDFIKRFANPSIVRPYLLLLKSYTKNTPHTNHCIVRMLHRLAVDLKMDALLFQLSVFHLFNKILNDPAAAAYKHGKRKWELVTFAKYVLSRFFGVAAQNNKAYVELLFWKNVGAVREMTEGYTKDGEGKKPSWTEEEEEELRRLYMEHLDSEVPDIVETVIQLLSNSSRTRRQVVTQLVHMGLVDNAKELKKPKKGTQIVLWTEEQELELEMLFEEYKDSDDVLSNIMKKLTAKRSRARIVDKLLSMGLVSERRELYKKRSRGAHKQNSRKGMTEEEFLAELTQGPPDDSLDQGDEDETDEESEDSEEDGNKREIPQPVRKRTQDFNLTAEHRADISNLVNALQQEGLSGPLLWLQNCLNQTAKHRDEDGLSQPVPLVPFAEANEDAMDNKNFLKLLRKLGIRPPENEQETFWRIPENISPSQLHSAAAALTPGEDGPENYEEQQGPSDSTEEPREQAEEEEEHDEEVLSEQRAQTLRALLLARNRKCHTAVDADPMSGATPGDKTNGVIERSQEKISTKRSRSRVLDDDNDEEEKENDSTIAMDVDTSKDADSDREDFSARVKRRRKMVLIDDEEDED
ncbi:hypothetical protein ILYODFUR_011628 [Ilyodon furcidens]|uniref:Timeless C-terminal domain-containing protein n=1 Tax=Ilyodon furcidens TaxID=33524 RepID=A0ABV0USE7_9TELE